METDTLPAPNASDRAMPPSFIGYVHHNDAPWWKFGPPAVYQRDILEKSSTWDSPDVWEVEVRFVRRVNA